MSHSSDNEIGILLNLDKTSGELKPSEVFEGYVEFHPSDEVKERIEKMLATELEQAISDWQPIFQEALENTQTYKAVKMTTETGMDILPSPLARMYADQIISWTYNTIIRPRPLVSIDPYFPQTYNVMFPVNAPGPDGQPIATTVTRPRDAEQVAATWELGYESILRERIGFPKKLQTVLTDCVTGASPCWLKVCYDYQTRPVVMPKQSGPFIDLTDKRESNVAAGDPIKWLTLPVFSVICPLDEEDPQAAKWIAEAIPLDPSDFYAKYYSGEYFLVDDDATADKLAENVTDTRSVLDKSNRPSASKPRLKCDIWEVWLYFDVKIPYEDAQGKKRKAIKRLSLLAHYHRGAGKLLCIWRNPYDHQLRPYVPCFQMEDPHSLSGSSTVGIVKWHQRIKTQLVGLEIQNASSANNVSFFVDPASEAYDYLLNAKSLMPNEVIPKRQDEYIEKWRKGDQHYSLLPLTQYIDADGQRASNVSSYETGENIPGRTAAATVSQILQQGSQQPLMFLRTISDAICKAIKLDLRTRRQFMPHGETFHVSDPETGQLLEVLFQFPVEEAIDNFRFSLTAADEELAKEHEVSQILALKNVVDQNAQFVAQIAGPMSNPQVTPAQANLFMKLLESNQAVMTRIVELTRTDVKKFDYTEAIEGIQAEREQAMMAAQMGAQNANPQAGGGVPGPGGAPSGEAPSGPPEEPAVPSGDGSGASGAPAAPPMVG